jgi:radical SAM protein with 4Fe4S-binding SPASM domain
MSCKHKYEYQGGDEWLCLNCDSMLDTEEYFSYMLSEQDATITKLREEKEELSAKLKEAEAVSEKLADRCAYTKCQKCPMLQTCNGLKCAEHWMQWARAEVKKDEG